MELKKYDFTELAHKLEDDRYILKNNLDPFTLSWVALSQAALVLRLGEVFQYKETYENINNSCVNFAVPMVFKSDEECKRFYEIVNEIIDDILAEKKREQDYDYDYDDEES